MNTALKFGGYGAIAAFVAIGCASGTHKPAANQSPVPAQEAPAAPAEAPKTQILAPSAMDQVTRAILDGQPIPEALEPDVPSETGDDAEACREAKQGRFDKAEAKAASKAMKALMKKKELPAACPDFIPSLDPNL
jgi:hypothetical protein